MPSIVSVGKVRFQGLGRTQGGISGSWRWSFHEPAPHSLPFFSVAEIYQLVLRFGKHVQMFGLGRKDSEGTGKTERYAHLRKQGIELSFSPLMKDAMGCCPRDLQNGDPTFENLASHKRSRNWNAARTLRGCTKRSRRLGPHLRDVGVTRVQHRISRRRRNREQGALAHDVCRGGR